MSYAYAWEVKVGPLVMVCHCLETSIFDMENLLLKEKQNSKTKTIENT